jgi:hypothetical protein
MSDEGIYPDGDEAHGFPRRWFVQAAGVASLPALAGCTAWERGEPTDSPEPDRSEPAAELQEPTESSPTLEIGPDLDLGGRLIVGAPDAVGYDTIQAAWEDAEDGDIVFVHASYDAQAAGEEFPITLDYTKKEVMLTGGHPSGSVIDASHAPDKNVIEVLGRAQNDYRNKALVKHLKIIGGNVGMRVRAATYSTYRDLVFWKNNSHGVLVEGYTDPDGVKKEAFGINFRNCMAWSCRGAGFKLDPSASPHSTTFYGCAALFNGLYGEQTAQPGVQLRGYSSRWMNGTIQNNGGFGIDARSGASQVVQGVYFEGNGMVKEYPHDIFVSESAPGFSLDGCYFQGGYFRDAPNGRDQSYRGIAVDGAPGVDIENCTFRNYTDAFVHVRDARDVDLHLPTHTALDATRLLDAWGNTRLRSNGMVLATDLRRATPAGRFEGDYGIHDGSGAYPWGVAVWDGETWVSVMNGKVLR